MCALDTPKGLMVVLACANYCVKKPEQADMVLLALDMNGKAMWQLNWNMFPAIQVIAGKVRYDLKDICTDGQVIYVVDKLNSTVYAVCREGRKVHPVICTNTNGTIHLAVSKRTKELITVNSSGLFSHYKLNY